MFCSDFPYKIEKSASPIQTREVDVLNVWNESGCDPVVVGYRLPCLVVVF